MNSRTSGPGPSSWVVYWVRSSSPNASTTSSNCSIQSEKVSSQPPSVSPENLPISCSCCVSRADVRVLGSFGGCGGSLSPLDLSLFKTLSSTSNHLRSSRSFARNSFSASSTAFSRHSSAVKLSSFSRSQLSHTLTSSLDFSTCGPLDPHIRFSPQPHAARVRPSPTGVLAPGS